MSRIHSTYSTDYSFFPASRLQRALTKFAIYGKLKMLRKIRRKTSKLLLAQNRSSVSSHNWIRLCLSSPVLQTGC